MKKYRFEQYAATRLYTGAIAYSPDGQTVAHVANTTGQFNSVDDSFGRRNAVPVDRLRRQYRARGRVAA